MNKPTLLTLVVIAVLLSGSIGYWMARTGTHQPSSVSASSPETDEPLFYRNPMNPAITSPVPAQDEMGMDYIPVFADSGAADLVPGTVLIDPVTTQSIGVRTTIAQHKMLARVIQTIGRIGYDESRIARLHPKTEGWIEEMRIATTGQTIDTDEILLSFYSPQLVSAQQEYLLARQRSGSASRELTQTSLQRLELLDVPAHQIEELQKSGKVKKYLHIHSPASGTVISVGARTGQYVTPKTELYFIADLSRVWVYVDIFEDELSWVQAGDQAQMRVRGIPGKIFNATVDFIYPYADTRTRTIKARLELDNPDLILKPDMYAEVRIFAQAQDQALAVPSEAIVRTGMREKVFVVREPGKFEPRDVTVGVSSDGWTQILSGLETGAQVVTSAQFLIDSESKLREAVMKMTEPAAMEMDHSSMEHPGMEMESKPEMDHSSMSHADMHPGTEAPEQPEVQQDMETIDHGAHTP